MAELSDRLPENAPGAYYVDSTCIDCDLCRQVAPHLLARQDELGYSYVLRQPVGEQEELHAFAAVEICPTSSIGSDGLLLELPSESGAVDTVRQG